MGFFDRGLLIEPILSEVYDWHFEDIQSEVMTRFLSIQTRISLGSLHWRR